jgi:hypothetical protein
MIKNIYKVRDFETTPLSLRRNVILIMAYRLNQALHTFMFLMCSMRKYAFKIIADTNIL